MLPGTGGFLGGFNADVLNATPTDSEQRSKLVEEIKNRAKTCIASRNFPEAVALYTKGIELTTTDHAALAILHANRSMCHLTMNKGSEALVDAHEAVRLDPSYIKGYYRLAMAHSLLHSYEHAREALQSGLARKPDDKELSTQLVKVEEKIRLEASTMTPVVSSAASVPASVPRAASTFTTKSNVSSSTVASAPSSSASSSLKTKSEVSRLDDDDDAELRNLNVRGYKKTADGKTTTFFNNEMDDKTRALIGSIAPKKLDAQGEVITTNVAPSSGSAWNAAGTYEEKILTVWATDALHTMMNSLTVDVSDKDIHPLVRAALPHIASLHIAASCSAEDVKGDAQVTLLRGKKKHVCDYTVTLKWTLTARFDVQHDNNNNNNEHRPDVVLSGSIQVMDISADRECEIDQLVVTHFGDNATSLYALPSDVSVLVKQYVKNQDTGLQTEIMKTLNKFWDELKTK